MNVKKEKLFGIITLVLCLLLFLERLTGGICHAILGILFIILLVVHICRQIGKLKYKKMSIRLVDWILLIAMIAVFLSGMLLHPLQEMIAIKILHKISSVVLMIGIILHVLLHGKKRMIWIALGLSGQIFTRNIWTVLCSREL